MDQILYFTSLSGVMQLFHTYFIMLISNSIIWLLAFRNLQVIEC